MITWEKVGSKFDYGANTSFSNGESLLYLTNANESISGNYSCIANNKVPKASPKTVKLGTFVQVKHKPIFSTGATKVPCDKEKVDVPKCVLSCEARGTPEVSISWLRKGNNLKDDTKYSISSSSTSLIAVKSELELKTVKSDDFDNYTCIASNGLGDQRQIVSLKVSGKPDPPVQVSRGRGGEGRMVWRHLISVSVCGHSGHSQLHHLEVAAGLHWGRQVGGDWLQDTTEEGGVGQLCLQRRPKGLERILRTNNYAEYFTLSGQI